MQRMYFVAVVLPKELDEKILSFKRHMHEKYGCKVGLKSPAHITLAPPFWLAEEMEPQVVAELETVSSRFENFGLATNNFSAFKPRTLFIAVAESAALKGVKKEVEERFASEPYTIKKENHPFHPHITIATRDLHKKDFAECWPQFENKAFAESFAATGLSLLRHNGRTWDVVFTANFTEKAG